jgi:predicted transcriptional regulator
MIVSLIASNTLPVLKETDKVQSAIELMADSLILHLPVVNEENQLLGLVDLDLLLDAEVELISELKEDYLENVSVKQEDSLRILLLLFQRHHLSMAPIVDEEGTLTGTVSQPDIINFLARLQGAHSPGGSLVIEFEARDYSLSQISRIAENNEAIILSSYIMNQEGSAKLLLYLHFNILDLSRLISAYERFGYHVVFSFHQSNLSDLIEERYDALMHYLNV